MQTIIEKAKKIKLVIFDVDGVLTDGRLYYSADGVELKAFNVRDGIGLKLLLEFNIEVGIITHHNSPIVFKRMESLGIQHVYVGQGPKLPSYEGLIQKLNLSDEQVAYVGDDVLDLPVLTRVGLSVAVADAPPSIFPYVSWKTTATGGHGAAREVCDLILNAQGFGAKIIERYLYLARS